MAKIEIKQLIPKDWADYRDVRLNGLKTDPTVFSSNFAKESAYSEQDWKERLGNPDVGIFGLFDGAKCIGMTGIKLDTHDPVQGTAVLWGSWIDPAYRGRGLSQMLYQARIEWAKNNKNVRRILVSHRESNQASFRANQKHGFRFTHKEDKTWPDGTAEPDVFYELILRS